MVAEFGRAEVEEQLANLKHIFAEKPENVKLTEKQLDSFESFFVYARNKVGKIKAVREAEKDILFLADAQDDRRLREERQSREDERRRIANEEERAERDKLQMRRERFANPPMSPAPTATGVEKSGTSINNNGNTHDTLQASTNSPSVDFLSFIKEDGAYLMLKKQQFSEHLADALQKEGLGYPLGVTYDEQLKLWLICDRNLSKIFLINVENNDIQICDGVSNPTAVMIYKEGHNAAVLSMDEQKRHQIFIYNYNTDSPYLQTFATYRNDIYDMKGQLRGLAKSVAGNILSLESTHRGKKLRVFNRNFGGLGFKIEGAQNPCFIATYRSTVAVSDLNVNKVFIMNLDDTDWDRPQFSMIHVIESTPDIPLERLANQNGFKYVAGMQFDANGYLLIGDAKGHSIKLYDTDYNFLHRISSDFVIPYVSSFHVNQAGYCFLLDVQGEPKYHWVEMTSIPKILPWLAPSYRPTSNGNGSHGNSGPPKRQEFQQNPRRGGFGFNSRNN